MATASTLAEKLRWRTEFLLKPGRFAEKELAGNALEEAVRTDLTREARGLRFRERLRFVIQAGERRSLDETLLLHRLRRSRSGESYFDLAGRRLHIPGYVAGSSRALDGILLILKEAFLMPIDFFSREVRIRRGDVVLDLGAHIGTSALLFSRLAGPGGHIFSFEPAFADVLGRTLRDNHAGNVTVVPCAVADAPGEAEFAVTEAGIDSRLTADGGPADGAMKVPVTTIDEFVATEAVDRVDFMKLDIEGGEEEALIGAVETLRRFRPRLSVASYHTDRHGRPQHDRLVRLLRGLDFAVREVGRKRIYGW